MGDDAEMYAAMREHGKIKRQEWREKRTAELMDLMKQGIEIKRLNEYQFRIEGRLDIYVTHGRWHDFVLKKRGKLTGSVTDFLAAWFKGNV